MRTVVLVILCSLSCALHAESQVERRLRDALTIVSRSEGVRPPTAIDRGVDTLVADGPLVADRAALIQRVTEFLKLYGEFATLESVYVRPYGRVEIAYFVVGFSHGVVFMRTVSLATGSDRIVTDIVMDPRPELVFPPALLGPDK